MLSGNSKREREAKARRDAAKAKRAEEARAAEMQAKREEEYEASRITKKEEQVQMPVVIMSVAKNGRNNHWKCHHNYRYTTGTGI